MVGDTTLSESVQDGQLQNVSSGELNEINCSENCNNEDMSILLEEFLVNCDGSLTSVLDSKALDITGTSTNTPPTASIEFYTVEVCFNPFIGVSVSNTIDVNQEKQDTIIMSPPSTSFIMPERDQIETNNEGMKEADTNKNSYETDYTLQGELGTDVGTTYYTEEATNISEDYLSVMEDDSDETPQREVKRVKRYQVKENNWTREKQNV